MVRNPAIGTPQALQRSNRELSTLAVQAPKTRAASKTKDTPAKKAGPKVKKTTATKRMAAKTNPATKRAAAKPAAARAAEAAAAAAAPEAAPRKRARAAAPERQAVAAVAPKKRAPFSSPKKQAAAASPKKREAAAAPKKREAAASPKKRAPAAAAAPSAPAPRAQQQQQEQRSSLEVWWDELTHRAEQLGKSADCVLPLEAPPLSAFEEDEEEAGQRPQAAVLEELRAVPVVICPLPVKGYCEKIFDELDMVGAGLAGGAPVDGVAVFGCGSRRNGCTIFDHVAPCTRLLRAYLGLQQLLSASFLRPFAAYVLCCVVLYCAALHCIEQGRCTGPP
jgi:hypothetical protein